MYDTAVICFVILAAQLSIERGRLAPIRTECSCGRQETVAPVGALRGTMTRTAEGLRYFSAPLQSPRVPKIIMYAANASARRGKWQRLARLTSDHCDYPA